RPISGTGFALGYEREQPLPREKRWHVHKGLFWLSWWFLVWESAPWLLQLLPRSTRTNLPITCSEQSVRATPRSAPARAGSVRGAWGSSVSCCTGGAAPPFVPGPVARPSLSCVSGAGCCADPNQRGTEQGWDSPARGAGGNR